MTAASPIANLSDADAPALSMILNMADPMANPAPIPWAAFLEKPGVFEALDAHLRLRAFRLNLKLIAAIDRILDTLLRLMITTDDPVEIRRIANTIAKLRAPARTADAPRPRSTKPPTPDNPDPGPSSGQRHAAAANHAAAESAQNHDAAAEDQNHDRASAHTAPAHDAHAPLPDQPAPSHAQNSAVSQNGTAGAPGDTRGHAIIASAASAPASAGPAP